MPAFDPTNTAIVIVALIACVLGLCAYLTLSERKIAAWIQDRIGPNRVGPRGLLQPIADGGKFFLKEEVIPSHVDKIFYLLAPAVAMGTALMTLAVVPFGPTTPPPAPVPVRASVEPGSPSPVAQFEQQQQAYQEKFNFVLNPGLDIGVLYIFALGSLAVYGVILAGWSANNKYSLLGSLRASAQIVSYEIPLGMSVLGVFLLVGSLNPEKIIAWQTSHGYWLILLQPLALLLFMTSVYAEANRLPFDLAEAEQELVGGYHTEYSSLKLGMMLLVGVRSPHHVELHHLGAVPGRLEPVRPGNTHRQSRRRSGLQTAGALRQDGRPVPVRPARSVDDPAVPLRPAHEPRLEGDDPAGAFERPVRDRGEAARRRCWCSCRWPRWCCSSVPGFSPCGGAAR